MSEDQTAPAPVRLGSLDAFRGYAMFLMLAEVLQFRRVADALPDSGFWKFLAHEQTHAAWIGCSQHDLIQPFFSFMVGVALPFSIAKRAARGERVGRTLWHAAWRALVLVLLGVFLRSVGQAQTHWTFEDTLSQIGLGYFFLFLLAWRSARVQWIAFAVIVVGYWLLFALYPLPGPDFNWAAAGTTPAAMLPGFAAHWSLNTNAAWAFDTWFLNLFPPAHWFTNNGGGYATLNFIPTLGTMILGLAAGNVLRSGRAPWSRVKWLAAAGALGLALGAALHFAGICPIVKRLWTPSWVLFSGGWCFLFLAGFYAVIDVLGRRAWAFPLIVIGMNSITAYCMGVLLGDFISDNLATHLGRHFFGLFGTPYAPLFHGALTLLVMWLILLWMHRRKLFLRI